MEDAGGNNVFEGGFLGLDNIGPIDRSHLPAGYLVEQSDATGWMGEYAAARVSIAAILTWYGQRQAQGLRRDPELAQAHRHLLAPTLRTIRSRRRGPLRTKPRARQLSRSANANRKYYDMCHGC